MDDDVVPLQRKQRQGAPAMFPPAPGSGTGAGSGADTTDEADVTGLTLSRTNAPAPARRSKPPSYRDLWLRFAAGSCAGRKANGATKANQDSYAIKTRVCGLKHAHIFGVFDGHGKLGHYVSGFVRDNLPDILAAELRTLPEDSLLYNARRRLTRSAQETELGRLAQCMKRALNETERRLNESPIEAYLSGTTAVVLLLIGRHAIVGNVGDSRCVLGSSPDVRDADRHGLDVVDGGLADKHVPRHARRSSAGLADVSTEHVLINARGLTVDQKPGDPSERARIESMGGFVQPILNRATNAFVGPDRVWSTKVQGRLPGLAMSRSIGDGCAGDVGVISDPVVTYHYLRPGRDHFLVLASDGVWEFIPNSEALDVVKNHSEPTDAAVALCRAAQQKWISTMGKLGSNVVDDITALVLCLWPTPQKSGSTSASSVGSRDSPASELTQ